MSKSTVPGRVLRPLPKAVGEGRGLTVSRAFRAKDTCPNHRQKYMFVCEWGDCLYPYCCGESECMRQHVHGGRLALSVFDRQGYQKLVERVGRCL